MNPEPDPHPSPGPPDPDGSPREVTRLLNELQRGDADAADRLVPLVYDELHRLAAGYMRAERADHTLQPTALVHEAYLKLVGQRDVEWRSRSHFLGIAAQAMRRVLVDHARRNLARKRGRGQKVTLRVDGELNAAAPPQVENVDLVALDEALARLGEGDPRVARVVELRYFAGLSVNEAAEVLGCSPVTVKRDWQFARAWLRRQLDEGDAP